MKKAARPQKAVNRRRRVLSSRPGGAWQLYRSHRLINGTVTRPLTAPVKAPPSRRRRSLLLLGCSFGIPFVWQRCPSVRTNGGVSQPWAATFKDLLATVVGHVIVAPTSGRFQGSFAPPTPTRILAATRSPAYRRATHRSSIAAHAGYCWENAETRTSNLSHLPYGFKWSHEIYQVVGRAGECEDDDRSERPAATDDYQPRVVNEATHGRRHEEATSNLVLAVLPQPGSTREIGKLKTPGNGYLTNRPELSRCDTSPLLWLLRAQGSLSRWPLRPVTKSGIRASTQGGGPRSISRAAPQSECSPSERYGRCPVVGKGAQSLRAPQVAQHPRRRGAARAGRQNGHPQLPAGGGGRQTCAQDCSTEGKPAAPPTGRRKSKELGCEIPIRQPAHSGGHSPSPFVARE
uniref:Uncharacterized protein n=1 Tax=Trichuris muris TaxID=70415 RepID=A0A5S6Q877_TRIMR